MSTSVSAESRPIPLWAIILACASVAGIAMGLRQVLGLYLKPVTTELGIGRETFGLAMAIANITWGIAAPFAGAVSDKVGSGRVVVAGALATAAGLYVMYIATTDVHLYLSGFLMGLGVAGTGVNALVGAVGRMAPPQQRAAAIAKLGMGAGIGVFLALPYTHLLMENLGWHLSLLILSMTALLMLPLAWPISGAPAQVSSTMKPQSVKEALAEAFAHPSFWLLNAGFFVCGFHVVFYGIHLPAYVADKGFDPSVAVTSLTLVGIFNLIGTYLAGIWGKHLPKRYGLSLIYAGRAVVFLCFLYLPITPTTVIVLSAALGLLWLSTVPLTSSLVATFYGPVWMTMLYGIVFFSHQVGSFLGVWMAGLLFDMTKSYDTMWWISVGLGVFAAIVHWPIRERPVPRLAAASAA
jgi:predicted MFS family arabinose efflux permease